MRRFSSASIAATRGALFCILASFWIGCSTQGPVRNVAYDPFVPNALLKYRERDGSVAYYGPGAEVRRLRTRTETTHKEVIVFDQ